MRKFRVLGSGADSAGAGYIGSKFFSVANQEYETDDPIMIDLLIKSKMAIEITEESPIEEKEIKQVGRPKKVVE